MATRNVKSDKKSLNKSEKETSRKHAHKIYENKKELIDFLTNQNLAGKIFIGPLNSSDSQTLNQFCFNGAIFFSFSSTTTLAKNCVFLINFFFR